MIADSGRSGSDHPVRSTSHTEENTCTVPDSASDPDPSPPTLAVPAGCTSPQAGRPAAKIPHTTAPRMVASGSSVAGRSAVFRRVERGSDTSGGGGRTWSVDGSDGRRWCWQLATGDPEGTGAT